MTAGSPLPGPALRSAALLSLDPVTLYRLLALRVDVFVVEQACAYRELDGRDLEPTTRHLWLEEQGQPLAYLRVLAEPSSGARIGRVCTATRARGRGLAAQLMRAALAEVGARPSVLEAQAHLSEWYAGFGFAPDGATYVEDGIPHLTMRRG